MVPAAIDQDQKKANNFFFSVEKKKKNTGQSAVDLIVTCLISLNIKIAMCYGTKDQYSITEKKQKKNS